MMTQRQIEEMRRYMRERYEKIGLIDSDEEYFKVIGNIHESPELVKSSEEDMAMELGAMPMD